MALVADLFPLSTVYSRPGYRYPYRHLCTSLPAKSHDTLSAPTAAAKPRASLSEAATLSLLRGPAAPQSINDTPVQPESGLGEAVVATSGSDEIAREEIVREERKTGRLVSPAPDTTSHSEKSVSSPTTLNISTRQVEHKGTFFGSARSCRNTGRASRSVTTAATYLGRRLRLQVTLHTHTHTRAQIRTRIYTLLCVASVRRCARGSVAGHTYELSM